MSKYRVGCSYSYADFQGMELDDRLMGFAGKPFDAAGFYLGEKKRDLAWHFDEIDLAKCKSIIATIRDDPEGKLQGWQIVDLYLGYFNGQHWKWIRWYRKNGETFDPPMLEEIQPEVGMPC